jgi:hypothetical protein
LFRCAGRFAPCQRSIDALKTLLDCFTFPQEGRTQSRKLLNGIALFLHKK